MRERTTWSRSDIQKQASEMSKRAEDPRAMNQDHIQRQPPADKYLTGDPSTFAEDVHPSAKNWKSEYSDGQTSRNEIGMPEMRDDTFSHPETDPGSSPARGGGGKSAALDEETLVKKADVCVKVARALLGSKVAESAIEDQALALMSLPDSDLIATVNRLAAQDQDDDKEQDKKQAAQDQQQDQGQQDKEAGQIPPQFKENVEKKKEEAKEKKEEKKAQDQQQDQADKEAGQQPPWLKKDDKDDKKEKKAWDMSQAAQQCVQAAQQGDQQALGQAVQQMVQQAMGAYGQTMSQQQIEQKIQQMIQQAVQQPQVQQQPQQQTQQSQQQMDQQALDAMLQQGQGQQDDQLIDQMLSQGQQPQQQANDFGIQMDSPQMDIGEVGMTPEDDVLSTLFANNQEVQNAQQAHVLQHGVPAPMQVQASQPMSRTASTRTVGTRPSGGVSSLGGLSSPAPAANGGEVEKLANLWNSAPDVSDVFRT